MANRGSLYAVPAYDLILGGNTTLAVEEPFLSAGIGSEQFGTGAGTVAGTITGAVALTVAQVSSGYYSANSGLTNRTVTLPTFAALTNATTGIFPTIGGSLSVGRRFRFILTNVGATNNLVITGNTNVTVKVADTGDATVTPGNTAIVELVVASATDIHALVTLYA